MFKCSISIPYLFLMTSLVSVVKTDQTNFGQTTVDYMPMSFIDATVMTTNHKRS